MIDIKKAKIMFLSLAFRGKLIAYPHNTKKNDRLDIIHKAQKNYQAVSEAEQLIDIPSHWNWSRLGYVTNNHGQTVPKEDFCYIDVGTLDNVHQRLAASENLVTAKDAPSRARKVVHLGDVLYSTVRPYLHNICIIDREFSRTPIASTAFCVMQVKDSVLLNKYLFYWLLTAEFDRYANGDPSKGALYPAIGEKDLLHGVIPLPSIEEQSMIVDRVEAAFSALDTIDTLQAQYADNFSVLKGKLIDAAIQGKLTKQLPEDGTAEELYQQIQEKKQALIKAGKIKKEKPLPNISENEIPFEIPSNWKWIRWGNVVNIVSARRVHQSDWRKAGVPFYRAREIAKLAEDGFVQNELFISEDLYDEFSKSGVPQENDLMVSAVGTLGRTYVVKAKDRFYYKDASVLCFENFGAVNPYYLALVMKSNMMQRQIESNSGGTTVDTLTMVRMVKYLMPLPPRAEQDRIVEAINLITKITGEL